MESRCVNHYGKKETSVRKPSMFELSLFILAMGTSEV
jgi:hypothetical protein